MFDIVISTNEEMCSCPIENVIKIGSLYSVNL